MPLDALLLKLPPDADEAEDANELSVPAPISPKPLVPLDELPARDIPLDALLLKLPPYADEADEANELFVAELPPPSVLKSADPPTAELPDARLLKPVDEELPLEASPVVEVVMDESSESELPRDDPDENEPRSELAEVPLPPK